MLAACLTLGWAAVAGAAWAGEPGKDGSLDDPRDACDRAAAMAEAAWQLPNGLLSAIGIVESGRGDPARARPVPWPWTINFDGHGYFLPDKAEAVQVVGIVRAAGRAVIDVGCFQVNLFYHPDAFTNIADAFDPVSNAQAAARILARARDGGNSWEAAIGLYHSASPDRAASLPTEGARGLAVGSDARDDAGCSVHDAPVVVGAADPGAEGLRYPDFARRRSSACRGSANRDRGSAMGRVGSGCLTGGPDATGGNGSALPAMGERYAVECLASRWTAGRPDPAVRTRPGSYRYPRARRAGRPRRSANGRSR